MKELLHYILFVILLAIFCANNVTANTATVYYSSTTDKYDSNTLFTSSYLLNVVSCNPAKTIFDRINHM